MCNVREMNKLKIIERAELPELKKLYDVYKPLHVTTTILIDHFIKRFDQKPEWTGIVKFLCLNDDDWKRTGTFVMINGHDDCILFNTLEPEPYESLHKILDLVNYEKPYDSAFRDVFVTVVLDVIRRHNLEITSSVNYKNFYYKSANTMEIEPPEGFYFGSLNERHVQQIDSKWSLRNSLSYKFLLNCVKQNPSTGLFKTVSDELAAWTIQHETGASGNLEVLDIYRRKGYAELVMLKQATKISADVTGYVHQDNIASIELMTKNGVQWVDNVKYFSVRPKTSPTLLAHL